MIPRFYVRNCSGDTSTVIVVCGFRREDKVTRGIFVRSRLLHSFALTKSILAVKIGEIAEVEFDSSVHCVIESKRLYNC